MTTNDKPPTLSFNQWLSGQHDGPHAALADAWKTSRGRLTRETVIQRATQAGLANAGAPAWDAYLAATGRPVPPTL